MALSAIRNANGCVASHVAVPNATRYHPGMFTVALISQKGGAGKTTLACGLAVGAVRTGMSTVLVDLDPQGSAATWHDLRTADTPVFARTTEERLTRVLAAARSSGAELAVIDTAPHVAPAARRAARTADLILIPCRPAAADLSAIGASIAIAKRTSTRTFAIVNAAPVRNPLVDQARTALAGYDVDVAPVILHNRIDHVHAFTSGSTAQETAPRSKAARELALFFAWVRNGALPLGKAT